MQIDQSTIDAIREIPIEDVISQYVDLKPAGSGRMKGCCPFHEEKTPSFIVNQNNQYFKCFGCGEAGDLISFYQKKEQHTFYDAIKSLAITYGIEVKYNGKETTQEERDEIEQMEKINQAAARAYQEALYDADPTSAANRFILSPDGKNIGFDQAITWKIGYAPDQNKFITDKVIQKGLLKPAVKLGLVQEKGGRNWDTFRDRIIFPIHDQNGKIVGFGGRRLNDQQSVPKYINSSDSPLYSKRKTLYGLYLAIPSIKTQGFANLVEGYTDVISLHKLGFTNTVGSCGTAFDLRQAKILRRYTEQVVLINDGDTAGIKSTLRSVDILIDAGLKVNVCPLPDNYDPDLMVRALPDRMTDIIQNGQKDGILWKSEKLLSGIEDQYTKHERVKEIAGLLSKIDQEIVREHYVKEICREFDLRSKTVNQYLVEAMKIKDRKNKVQRQKRKNKVVSLDTHANIYPFFVEILDKNQSLRDIKINKVKFTKLLGSFGYTRYELENDKYTFVKISENVISQSSRDEIIDYLEHFIRNDYDFEGAGCDYVESEDLINKLYDGMRSYFSKDLFNRIRQDDPIEFNKDEVDAIYLYFKNGFVKVTKDSYDLHPYSDMTGNVWDNQLQDRDFVKIEDYMKRDIEKKELGNFADFCLTISGYSQQRLGSLCSIIGYLIHDYYDYKLKAILFTDSSLSEYSDGRSGKTLLAKMIGFMRSYCEINGKDFNATDPRKYQNARLGTQVLHLNDVRSKGKNKFVFEDVFNDVTEGYTVDAKYLDVYRQCSKIIISCNKTLDIKGSSERDRIVEFELAQEFNEDYSPLDKYKQWFGRDWDKNDFQLFDNFMCSCCQIFLEKGLVKPDSINLEERKLLDHTSPEFIEFMAEIEINLESTGIPFTGYHPQEGKIFTESESVDVAGKSCIQDFEFDKNKLYNHFRETYADFTDAKWFTVRLFTKWIKLYGELKFGIKQLQERRSNNTNYFIFQEKEKK